MAGYTLKSDPENSSRAIGKEIDISPKKAVEVCRTIRGMKVTRAIDFLEKVESKDIPINYKRNLRGAAHKKGKGNAGGGFPIKVASEISKVLLSAQANAEYKGLDPDEMYIKSATANKGRVTRGYMPRAHSRSSPFDHESVNIEIILESTEVE